MQGVRVAPEMINTRIRSKASDVYSLGIIIWELMTSENDGIQSSLIYDDNDDTATTNTLLAVSTVLFIILVITSCCGTHNMLPKFLIHLWLHLDLEGMCTLGRTAECRSSKTPKLRDTLTLTRSRYPKSGSLHRNGLIMFEKRQKQKTHYTKGYRHAELYREFGKTTCYPGIIAL